LFISWSSFTLPPEAALTALLAGYGALLVTDGVAAKNGQLPPWYMKLRIPISLLIIGSLGTTYLLGDKLAS